MWVSTMGLLVVLLASGTAIIVGASYRQYHGVVWADDVCSMASTLCASPGWMVALTMLTALVYLYRLNLNS